MGGSSREAMRLHATNSWGTTVEAFRVMGAKQLWRETESDKGSEKQHEIFKIRHVTVIIKERPTKVSKPKCDKDNGTDN